MSDRLAQLQAAVGQLASGAAGPLRRGLETEAESAIHELSAELKGEAPMPLGYCGSCYGELTLWCSGVVFSLRINTRGVDGGAVAYEQALVSLQKNSTANVEGR